MVGLIRNKDALSSPPLFLSRYVIYVHTFLYPVYVRKADMNADLKKRPVILVKYAGRSEASKARKQEKLSINEVVCNCLMC